MVSMKRGLRKRQAKRGGMCGCGKSLTRPSGYSEVGIALDLGSRDRAFEPHYSDHDHPLGFSACRVHTACC